MDPGDQLDMVYEAIVHWADVTGAAEDKSWRLDGVHLSEAGSTSLANTYLGPLLVNTALG